MFKILNRGVESIFDDVIALSYYMRGAIPYESMMMRTPGERQRIGKFVEQRLEMASKTMFPSI